MSPAGASIRQPGGELTLAVCRDPEPIGAGARRSVILDVHDELVVADGVVPVGLLVGGLAGEGRPGVVTGRADGESVDLVRLEPVDAVMRDLDAAIALAERLGDGAGLATPRPGRSGAISSRVIPTPPWLQPTTSGSG